MEYHFNLELAEQYGLSEAVFMHNIVFWCWKNECNGTGFRDGHYWTYNTNDALRKLYPFWSKGQIERIIAKCVENGLLLVKINNKKAMDRTRSFACTEIVKCIYRKREMDLSESEKPFPGNEKCFNKETDNRPDINPDKKQNSLLYADQMGADAAALIAEFLGDDDSLREAFDDYVQMRKKKKSPIKTLGTAKRTIARLKSLSGENREHMIRILDQSIRKNWTDVYPLDEDRYRRGGWEQQTGGSEVVEQEDYSYGDE